MAEIIEREDGYVSVKTTNRVQNGKHSDAIQYLEDGLSYLNYARLDSNRGLKDPEKDYETGMGFIRSALQVLAEEEEKDDK